MKNYFFIILCCVSQIAFAQNEIKGRVVDSHKMPIPGVEVSILNTGIQQTTDNNGDFLIHTYLNTGEIQFEHAEFKTVSRAFNFKNRQSLNIGEIRLTLFSSTLEEVVIIGKGIIDLERNRKTPTAVSTITKEEIRSEEHTSELQSRGHLVCRLPLEKKK